MKQEITNFSLKDQLFNKKKVEYLANNISAVYPEFESSDFVKNCVSKFEELELMWRLHHIADMFAIYLVHDDNWELEFEKSLEILVQSLPKELDPSRQDNDFWDFILGPYSDFVAKYGIKLIQKHEAWSREYTLLVKKCFSALEDMTKRFSVELSIRHFFNEFPEETLAQFILWSKSGNYHVRRLSSEGSRPKLPWACKIMIDYKRVLPILDNLYIDSTRYVTRSVANHLNDIAKIDPSLVIETLQKWKKETTEVRNADLCFLQAKDLDYIISHSTRTLVKSWDIKTLNLLWYNENINIKVSIITIKKEIITIWESLDFVFDVNLKNTEKLIIDYKIYFVNKKWLLQPKVFKIKKWEFSWNVIIQKKHVLTLMTTKSLYAWMHILEIIINWKSYWKKEFELRV